MTELNEAGRVKAEGGTAGADPDPHWAGAPAALRANTQLKAVTPRGQLRRARVLQERTFHTHTLNASGVSASSPAGRLENSFV